MDEYLCRAKRKITFCLVSFLLMGVGGFSLTFVHSRALYLTLLIALFALSGLLAWGLYEKMHMSMNYTNRLMRFLVLNTALYTLLFFAFIFTKHLALWCATPFLAPVCLLLSAVVSNPLEKRNNRHYLLKAKERLREMPAIKIGITGSYAKTSVKNALTHFLSQKYKTLVTPANYNTPLGIAKTLQEATGNEEICVFEMGARRKGDIRELCEMISPTVGVLTGIAPQHLETFGSQEVLLKEKGELARFVPSNDMVFYNLTDPLVSTLYRERIGKKIGVGFVEGEYLIQQVEITSGGSSFSLVHGKDRLRISLKSVGKACVINVALAAAIALELGVPANRIEESARELTGAPHRFEVMESGGVTVIDDSYNINPIGAAVALDTLCYFGEGRKVVYCSGMVELGKEEEKCNLELGKKIAECCSLAIVAEGRYGDMVERGIKRANCACKIMRVKNTEEASLLFKKVLKRGDVLLIMSDLPRDYLV